MKTQQTLPLPSIPMSDARYNSLMQDPDAKLTREEFEGGWHFCEDWDGMLIASDWAEARCCKCLNR